ncbi:MAG: winged helix-turn-helix transcriptional regulator [Bacteroidales bacterium]|jgi:predicted transcriptional regulator|nr:winged helix-turn-helix transcriptional regulator [Bacteroidales bacterium]
MPVIKYLTILRKKLIESIIAMRDAEMNIVDIADKTGLSIQTVKKII